MTTRMLRQGVAALVLLLALHGPVCSVADEESSSGPGFAGVQQASGLTLWRASGLDRVPEDVLEYACTRSFLEVKHEEEGSSPSPYERKQSVRQNARHSCLKIMKAVERQYELPPGQASTGLCSELQTSVNSGQDEGQIFGSVSLADLFETAETYPSQMNWRLFCSGWSPKVGAALQHRTPHKRRMLNMRRVRSSLHRDLPSPQEKPEADDSPSRAEPDAVASMRTAEIVDLVATGTAARKTHGSGRTAAGASLLQEVETIHPFGHGGGHLEAVVPA